MYICNDYVSLSIGLVLGLRLCISSIFSSQRKLGGERGERGRDGKGRERKGGKRREEKEREGMRRGKGRRIGYNVGCASLPLLVFHLGEEEQQKETEVGHGYI